MNNDKLIIAKQQEIIELLQAPQYFEVMEAVKRKKAELAQLQKTKEEQPKEKSIPDPDNPEHPWNLKKNIDRDSDHAITGN